MFNKQEIIKNVSGSETKMFLAKGLDKAELTFKKHETAFSDFSDPVKAVMLKDLAEKHFGIKAEIFGGYEGAERVLVGFCSDYIFIEEPPIRYILISYNENFSKKLSHRDFLGSILGLGLDRGRIGDIVLTDAGAVAVVKEAVADFIVMNLERVGHTKVRTEIIENAADYLKNDDVKEFERTTASLRTDAVISTCFNVSRGKACDYIRAGRVFINWAPAESVSKQVSEESIITVRGLGRVKLLEVMGKTKKDKTIIKFRKF